MNKLKKIYTRAFIDEQNVEDNSRKISGRAIVFDSPSRYMGYIEYINRNAISQALIDTSDIIFNYNHDDNQMLARSTNGKGTLSISLREDGVYFEFEAPETTLGDEVLWHVRHGNLTDCSFAFTIPDNGTRSFKDDEGNYCREITEIDGLYDMTICAIGAYADTLVEARAHDLEIIKRSLGEDTQEEPEATTEEQKEDTNEETQEAENEELEEKNLKNEENSILLNKFNNKLKAFYDTLKL